MPNEQEAVSEELNITTAKHFTGAVPAKADVLAVSSLGEGLRLVSERKTLFTNELAEKILSLDEFVGDRGLRNRHVEYIMLAMKRETFLYELVKLIICRHAGKEWRMNGQHVCWARCMLEQAGAQLGDNHVVVTNYEASSEHDMRRLYSSIDRNAPRSKSNVVISYLAGTSEYGDFSDWVIKKLAAGLAVFKWPTRASHHDGDDVAYLLQTEHLALARLVGTFLQAGRHDASLHIARSAVVAAMFATFDKAQKDSEEFWGPVRDGVGMSSIADPRLKLRSELMRSSVTNAANAATDKKRVSGEDMYAWCINAWNAWRQKKPLQALRGTCGGKRPPVK